MKNSENSQNDQKEKKIVKLFEIKIDKKSIEIATLKNINPKKNSPNHKNE